MMKHEAKEWIAAVPCPRCGCYLTRHFACNCGEVHSDYCVNCGRFTSLSPSKSIKLSPNDARCEAGPTMHAHPFEEKAQRMAAVHELIRQEVEKAGAKTFEEVKVVIDRIYGIGTRG